MLNSHRKTIGVFINRSESEFQQITMQGLVSEAQQYGFNVAFMDSYGIRESENMYDIIQNNLQLLGDYKSFYLCLFDQRNADGILEFYNYIPL